MNHVRTFRQIEQHLGLNMSSSLGESPLEAWYERVRDKQLAEFSDEDLAKSCRQELFLDFVVPFAVERIETDPLAGELYDGELLEAVALIMRGFWLEHQSLANRLCRVITQTTLTDDKRVLQAIDTLRERIGHY